MGVVKKTLALALAAAVLPGCGGDDKDGRSVLPAKLNPAPVKATALYNPAEGADFIPFPTDLLFASTADGSINIPDKLNSLDGAALLAATGDLPAQGALITAAVSTPVSAALADPQTSLNTMDGWSNTAPMVVRFSDNIASPSGPDYGVRVFATESADPGAAGPVAIDRELVYGVDFVAGANGSSLLIIPIKPMEASTTHIIAIDSNLTTTSGDAVTADGTFQLVNGAFQLEAAMGPGMSDFILDSSGDSCDFADALSVLDCTDVNTEDYQFVVDNVPPAAAGAAAVVGALTALETAGDIESILLLEQLRRIASKQIGAVVNDEGVDPTTLSLLYSVTTQNVGGALLQARGQVEAADSASITILNPLALWDDGSDAAPYEVISPGADGDLTTPDHLAHIYLGNLSDMLSFVDPTDANNTVWEALQNPANWADVPACNALPADATGSSNLVGCNGYNPEPKLTDHSVPVLVSAPRAESLAGGGGGIPDCSSGDLPVVIYQHGITSNRASLLALADSLAQACIVGVAIDLPKHGILPANDPFGASDLAQLQQALQQPPFAAANPSPTIERLVVTSSPAEGCSAGSGESTLPDNGDFYCPSGDNFINLANLANSRDTLRQGVTDLHTLRLALSNEDTAFETAIGTTIDESNISFVGVSLGGLVGTPFLGTATDLGLTSAVLNVTSGNIAKLLDGSPSFGPAIADGLYASGGIAKPSGDYEGFLIIAQTHVDNSDPINFAETVGEFGPPMLVQELVGNGDATGCVLSGNGCPDQVVPNNVFGSSFGPAWGVIDQINAGLAAPSQSSFLPGQDFFTTPVALAGTDALAQGTSFVGLATLLELGLIDAPTAGVTGVTDSLDILGSNLGSSGFKGLGLDEVFACGDTGEGIVRFTSGSHSSLLSPSSDLNTTVAMQTQVATYIATGGVVIAADPNADTADQVVRSDPTGSCD